MDRFVIALIVIIGGITGLVLYEILLEKAMAILTQLMEIHDTNIPVYSAWIQQNGTLSVGIDDRIAKQSLDVYKQRLTNRLGNIPMNLHFGHFFDIHIINPSVDIASGSGSSTNPDCVSTQSCFYPNPLTVSMGDTVTWTNKDLLSHTVTSGIVNADDVGALYDSKIMKSGQTFKFTFTKVGTYDYFCVLHPWMQGQVIVK